jgi:hypothetical protein
MRPLYDDNVKPSLWAKIKSWFDLDYWAYRRLRRRAQKAGTTYAVTGLPPAAAAKLAKTIDQVAPINHDRAIDSVVPPVFQRPSDPPNAAEIARGNVQKHFDKLEQQQDDAAAMREVVQVRLAAKQETPEQAARRVIARVKSLRKR